MTVSTITPKQQQQITDLLSRMTLPVGLGDKENACSIAAINLALTGKLTDKIPDCMSEVIGKFIIIAQDSMPSEMRNSAEWKRLLPLAAGTGRKCESERMALIVQWMWETVLPTIQPFADENGFGTEWRVMLQQRTTTAVYAARAAAHVANAAAHATAATDANATAHVANAVYATAVYATDATVYATDATATATAANAANAAANAAATATAHVAARAAAADAWRQFNPCDLLGRLITAQQEQVDK